ncbi:MAG: ATP-binding protein [Acidimicrobiia bacterium]
MYVGTNVLSGGASFAFDPFEAYASGVVTNPNVLIAGEPGAGKSALVKTFLARSVALFGTGTGEAGSRAGRWIACADPKGEYAPLAEVLGLDVVRLSPGGTARVNPLDAGPGGAVDPEELARRRTDSVGALAATVLRRELTPLEDAAVGWAVDACTHSRRSTPPTLVDVTTLLRAPTGEMASRAGTSAEELARGAESVALGLGKLLDRSLRGMFDGPTTINLDWTGTGLVLDLSAVHHDRDALGLVLLAATAWWQSVLSRPDGPRRIQVLDEAWCLLGSERTSRYLQSCWKLSRAYGVANMLVVHRLSDLRAQADDGTATAKVSSGLLADTQTRVLLRQSSDQIDDAQHALGLTGPEAALLPRLARGRALWKIAGRTAVVQHVLGTSEHRWCNTDAAMAGA